MKSIYKQYGKDYASSEFTDGIFFCEDTDGIFNYQ